MMGVIFLIVSLSTTAFFWGKQKEVKVSLPKAPSSLYEITINNLNGDQMDLTAYEGKVILVVNVASRCGYTPQYKGLEKIYQRYKDDGFSVLGVPSNDFMGQEPGTAKEIKQFCELNYGVTFPLTEKIHVKGKNMHDLYRYFHNQPSFKGTISWNFNKILVDKTGAVIKRYGSNVNPTQVKLTKEIESQLAAE